MFELHTILSYLIKDRESVDFKFDIEVVLYNIFRMTIYLNSKCV